MNMRSANTLIVLALWLVVFPVQVHGQETDRFRNLRAMLEQAVVDHPGLD